MSQWYYSQNGQRFGPLSDQHLRQLLAQGQVNPHDLVWTSGMPQWQRAAEMAALNRSAAPPIAAVAAPPVYVAAPLAYPTPAGFSQGRDLGEDAAMRWLMPVGRAIFGLIMGILGTIALLTMVISITFGGR